MRQCVNHPDRRGVAVVCDECARKARGHVCRNHPDRVANYDRVDSLIPGARVPMCQECMGRLERQWLQLDVRFIP
jgi:hypothetical protein